MASSCFYLLIILIIGIVSPRSSIFLPKPTPAISITNFTLFQPAMEVEVNTPTIIPCSFHTNSPLKSDTLKLEWGKSPLQGGRYTPKIELYGDKLKVLPKLRNKYKFFVPLVPRGNCSLIFTPTDTKDSGIYEVWLTVKGTVFAPPSKLLIQVLRKKTGNSRSFLSSATATPNTTTGDFIDKYIIQKLKGKEKTVIIVVLSVGLVLIITSLLSCVACIMYCARNKTEKQ